MTSKQVIAVLSAVSVLILGIIGLTVILGDNSSDDGNSQTKNQDVGSETDESSKANTNSEEKVKDEPAEESIVVGQEVVTETPGQYVEYYDGIVQQLAGDNILFFHADWCPQCVKLEEDIKAKGLPNNVNIIEVDFDERTDLRRQYGVNFQTTLVKVDGSGAEVARYGAYSTPDIDTVLQNL